MTDVELAEWFKSGVKLSTRDDARESPQSTNCHNTLTWKNLAHVFGQICRIWDQLVSSAEGWTNASVSCYTRTYLLLGLHIRYYSVSGGWSGLNLHLHTDSDVAIHPGAFKWRPRDVAAYVIGVTTFAWLVSLVNGSFNTSGVNCPLTS
jgi:hypothetical protein